MTENDGIEMDIINLLDEEGNEHEFEIVDATEYKDNEYLALVPVFKEAADNLEDSGELVILRVGTQNDDEGDSYLEAVTDEEEYTAIANIFMERLEDEFDFEEGDDEDEDEDDLADVEDEVEEVD